MANGQLFLAKEDRVDFYNNILTLKVKSEMELKAVDLRGDIVPEGGMRVIAVGRTFYTYSFIDYAGELYEGYPHFGCQELLRSSCCTSHQICEGGAMITYTGHVLGMNFYGAGDNAHLIPTRVIQSCLEMWRSLGTVSRPWIGFSVADVKQTPFHIQEKLNSYVIVKEVFDEALDLHSSDSVSVNGMLVQSAKQYSELLSQAVLTDSADSSQSFVLASSRMESVVLREIWITKEPTFLLARFRRRILPDMLALT